MNVRKVKPEEIRALHFAHHEVLNEKEAKDHRDKQLHRAAMLCNLLHEEIGIVFQLDTGEVIETYAPIVDYADSFVELKGGYWLPVWAIVEVED